MFSHFNTMHCYDEHQTMGTYFPLLGNGFKAIDRSLYYRLSLSRPRVVPWSVTLDIDPDREMERIYSLFKANLAKLEKLQG